MKWIFRVVLTFSFLVLVTGVLVYFSVFYQSPSQKLVQIVVSKNQTVPETKKKLIENNILKFPRAFDLALKLTKKDKDFKTGIFTLSQPSSVATIIDTLTQTQVALTNVLIPEGFALKNIALRLEKLKIVSAQEFLEAASDPKFLKSLDIHAETAEGYLLPETYQFEKNTSAQRVIKKMVRELFDKIKPAHLARAQKLNLNQHEWITLASIIEKEAANDTEYRTIASVFFNRLNKGMKLESDPTIIYGIPDYDGNIKRKHIRMPHPYNTYVIKALPPGPIASPGWAALEATLEPETTDYLFFVADHNRKHVFSKTYSEHKKNVYKYQIKKK